MFKRMSIYLLIGLTFLTMKCKSNTNPLNSKQSANLPRELTSTENVIVEADADFGLKLFKTVNQHDSSDNIFISPLSVSMALGMTLNGAAGQTYDDMKSTLELNGLSEDEINKAYKSLIDLLLNLDDKVIFDLANSIWPREDFQVLPAFMEINQKYFYSEAKSLDFTQSDAVDIINSWISEKTHGKIENMLDYIPPDAVMYLINTIYFKGTWTYQFDEAFTSTENFYSTPQNPNNCEMMKISGNWLYNQDNLVQIVDMPYGDSLYSMTVIVPVSGTVDEFIEHLTPETWTDYFSDLEYKKGTIIMPKLKLDYKITLNDALIDMGMGIAFNHGGNANFSRINGSVGLFISRVLHQSFIQIDEEGTEAAAATIVEVLRSTASPQVDFFMRVDRPYIFVIRERIKNTILFLGKISNPVWRD